MGRDIGTIYQVSRRAGLSMGRKSWCHSTETFTGRQSTCPKFK